MRFNLRWQLLLATVGFALAMSLLSFQSQTVGLCSTQVPAAGGKFTEGIVGKPGAINPLFSDNLPVDRELTNLVFDGLTRYDHSGMLRPALAESWSVNEDGLSLRFQLRRDVKWHDGEPFTSRDVAFTYGLMQDPAFNGSPSVKQLWQAVEIEPLGDYEISFTLPEPYAPFLDATTRGILPAHVWSGEALDGPFAPDPGVTPVGTGPFMVNPGQEWERSGRIRLSPNPEYWRQGTQIGTLEFHFFPDDESLASAFVAGELHAINSVPHHTLSQIASAEGVRLFTTSARRYTALLYNVDETLATPMNSLPMRRAATYAIDRSNLIGSNLTGQGVPLDGPYLPSSWAYNPRLQESHFQQPISATQLLESEGWLLSGETGLRFKDGDVLALRIVAAVTEPQAGLAMAVATNWRDVGIEVELTLVEEMSQLIQLLNEGAFDAALVDISPPADPDLYDFWSQEATVRGQGFSGWNNRKASEALEGGRKLWSIEERRPYYDLFQVHFDAEIPAVSLYQHVKTYALSGDVHRVEIGLINDPRDRYRTFADWFLLHREVSVICTEEAG